MAAQKQTKAQSAINQGLKPSEAKAALKHLVTTGKAGFLWGPPGIGKSQIMKQIANELGMGFRDIRLSQMDPTDLRGIPYPVKEYDVDTFVKILDHTIKTVLGETQINTNVENVNVAELVTKAAIQSALDASAKQGMRWAAPALFPRNDDDRVIILLDELNAAPPSIQAAAYQLVLDRELGEYKLPKGCAVIAAGNRETDKGATFKMATPLMNRFVHLEMRSDFEDWQAWALENMVNKDVVGFLTFQKSMLFDFEPSSASRGFQTPRSWSFVSDMLNNEPNLPAVVLNALVEGAVGAGASAHFMTYRKNAAELPPPMDILTGKVKKISSKDVSVAYALTTGLCYELKIKDDEIKVLEKSSDKDEKKKGAEMRKNWHKWTDVFMTFMMDSQFGDEMVILGVRTALAIFKLDFDPEYITAWDRFHNDYGDMILGA